MAMQCNENARQGGCDLSFIERMQNIDQEGARCTQLNGIWKRERVALNLILKQCESSQSMPYKNR